MSHFSEQVKLRIDELEKENAALKKENERLEACHCICPKCGEVLNRCTEVCPCCGEEVRRNEKMTKSEIRKFNEGDLVIVPDGKGGRRLANEGDLVIVPDGKGGRRLAKVHRDYSDDGEDLAIWVGQWIDGAWYAGYHPFGMDEVKPKEDD